MNETLGDNFPSVRSVSEATSLDPTSTTTTTATATGDFSDAYKWYMRNSNTANMMSSAYLFTGSSLSIILNSYFLGVMGSKKDLRTLMYVPAMLQSLADLLAMGVMVIFTEAVRISFIYDWDNFRYKFDGFICRALREQFFDSSGTIQCIGYYFRRIVNTYCTGPCVLAMAIDRYIIVCCAATAKQIMTPRVRIGLCSAVFLATLGPSLAASYSTFVVRNAEVCLKSFYPSLKIRNRVDNSLFFVLPAIICLVLYFRVASTLLKTRSQRSRNRSLTKAFLISTMLWIVLWAPNVLYVEYSVNMSFEEYSKMGYAYFVWMQLVDYLYINVSFLNPLIFLFISRSFQHPIKSLWSKMLCKKDVQRQAVPTSSSGTTGSTKPNPSSSR